MTDVTRSPHAASAPAFDAAAQTRRARRNFLYYFGFHGARYLFPLVLTPFLARTLGPGAYADFVLWNACVWACSMLMEFGFYLYAVNRVALVADRIERQAVISAVVTAKLMLAPMALLAYAAAAYGLGLSVREPVATAIGAVAVLSYGASFAWLFQGVERGGAAVALEAAPLAAQFAFVIALTRGPADLWIVAALQSMVAVVSLVGSLALMRRLGLRLSLRLRGARRALREALPYFIERLCYTTYSTATPMMIALLSTREQVAYYGVGDKFNTFLTAASTPLTLAALPAVSRLAALDRTNWRPSLKLVGVNVAITATLAALSFGLLEPGVRALFGGAYAQAVGVAQLFCVTAIIMSAQLALSNFILIPGGAARRLVVSSTLGLAVGLALQLALTHRFGAAGAVVARTASEAVVLLVVATTAWRLARPRAS